MGQSIMEPGRAGFRVPGRGEYRRVAAGGGFFVGSPSSIGDMSASRDPGDNSEESHLEAVPASARHLSFLCLIFGGLHDSEIPMKYDLWPFMPLKQAMNT
mmetsp:Transcript_102236/g.295810  ORF Transcript_102236/g.295810 Transcript_102236/m.295810 type:complete len:100 (-) Transcript_102236:964-1263(-)